LEDAWALLLALASSEPFDLDCFEAAAFDLPWTVSLKDGHDRIVAGNRLLARLNGFDLDAVRGQTYAEFAARRPALTAEARSVQAADAAAWASPGAVTLERSYLDPWGELMTMRVIKQSVHAADGTRQRLLTMGEVLRPGFDTGGQHVMAEHLYRLLAHHTHDLVFVLEPDGRCRYASPSVARLLGAPTGIWVGSRLSEHAALDDAIRLDHWIADAAATGQIPAPLQHGLRTTDGLQRDFESVISPLFEDPEQPARVTSLVCAARDITPHRQALEAATRAAARLARAQAAAGLGDWEFDVPSGAFRFSPAMLALCGLAARAQPPTARDLRRQVNAEDWPRVRAAIDAARDQGRESRLDYRLITPAGREVVLATTIAAERGPDGRVHTVYGTAQDITDRVRQARELDGARQRLQLALRASGTGIEEYDASSGELRWDATLKALGGFTDATFAGTLEQVNRLVHPDDLPRVVAVFNEALRGGSPVPLDFRMRRVDDGTERVIELTATRVPGPDGMVVAGVCRDVTQRRLDESALRASEANQSLLVRLSDTLQPAASPEEACRAGTRLLGEHLRAQRVGLAVLDGDTVQVVAQHVRGVAAMPGHGPAIRLGPPETLPELDGVPTVIDDLATDPRVSAAAREAYARLGVRALVRIVLQRQGQQTAVFGVHRSAPHRWTAAEVGLIREVAERTWSRAERTRAEQLLRASELRQAFLVRLGDALRTLQDPEQVQGEATRLLGEQLRATRVGYAEDTGHGQQFIVSRCYVEGASPLLGRHRYDDFDPGLAREMRAGRTIARPDVAGDPGLSAEQRAAFRAAEVGALVNVPLVKAGRLVAFLLVHSSVPRVWRADEVGLIEEVAERLWATLERARAEAALRERDLRLRLALEAATMGTFVWDAVDDRAEPDERLRTLFGMPARLPLPKSIDRYVHPDDRDAVRRAFEAAIDPGGRGVMRMVVRATPPDGSIRWMELVGRTQFDGTPPRARRLYGVASDVTEREATERALADARDQLRLLSIRQETELDAERQRLALDVHDELGQQLTALKIQVALCEAQLHDSVGPGARRTLQRINDLLDTTIEVTRDIAARLRPLGDAAGLAGAVARLAEEFELRVELPCRFRVDGDPEAIDGAIGGEDAVNVLRIVQESLTNVARHARASAVEVSLRLEADTLWVGVHDNGVGFEPRQVPNGRLGLLGMRERARRLGATLDIQSDPARGTTVSVAWPRRTRKDPT
jgi:PAS domain S-box-containing protein